MTAPRPNVRLDPWEQAQRETPDPPLGLPWREVLGWCVVGLLLWAGIFWLVAKVIEP